MKNIIFISFLFLLSFHNIKIFGAPRLNSKKMARLYKTELYQTFYKYLDSKGIHSYYIPRLFCIAKLESNFDPYAFNINKNGTIDVGLLQINSIWYKHCKFPLYKIENNVSCAKTVLEKQGLKAWVTYNEFGHICEKSISLIKDNIYQ